MKLTSTAFAEQEAIPQKYTCQGADVSPALSWSGAPEGTKSFALVVDDPDAPDPTAPTQRWVHWVLCDLPASVTSLEENVDSLPQGTVEGLNDWNDTGYRGPCPPRGCHRYFFKLYALDEATLGLSRPTRSDLERAMEGHILARTELIGTYVKSVDLAPNRKRTFLRKMRYRAGVSCVIGQVCWALLPLSGTTRRSEASIGRSRVDTTPLVVPTRPRTRRSPAVDCSIPTWRKV